METAEAVRPPSLVAAAEPLGDRDGPLWMRAIAACIGALPRALLGPLGCVVGWIAGSLLRIRRREVEASIARAGIDRPSHVARSTYASLGVGLIELLWLAGRDPEAIAPLATLTDRAAKAFERAAAYGRGIVLATAHTGNWDLAACAMARFQLMSGRGFFVITKRLSWRALDRYWQHLRARRGVALLDARGAYRSARRALRSGDVVAMLVDQAPVRTSGVAVLPFLGTPANHDLAPAMLALRAGAPILVAFARRDAEGHHLLDVVDVIDPPSSRATEAAAIEITARVSRALGEFVRAYPDQWLWLHRRWKGVSSLDERQQE